MKHLGDITKISGFTAPVVDIITGGSPCQDLSVAGKRAGLAGDRSGLFMEQIRIIKEMRENDKRSGRSADDIRPRYMVWENVPGAFSSNKGEDFRAVLKETARIAKEDAVIPGLEGWEKWRPAGCIMGDGWSIAWRVHDAQFWGVPQRRKRIALVADFGGTTAPEILFEHKSVSGDIEEIGKEGQRVATDVRSGVEETGRVASTITAAYGTKWNGNAGAYNGGNFVIQERAEDVERSIGETSKAIGFHLTQDPVSSDELSYACSCGNSKSGQCVNGVVYGIGGYNSKGMLSNNPNSGIYEAETARTLDLNGGSPACNQGGMAVVQGADVYNGELTGEKAATLTAACGGTNTSGAKAVCIWNGQVAQLREQEKVGTLNCMHDQQAVITYGLDRASFNQGQNAKYNFSVEEEKIGAQVARGPGAVCQSVVRRLTPLECERLQGFPDGWTDIGDWVDSKGKKHKGDSDSPRYKALGNSIALPFWQWIAERMCRYIENPTMASLFDGIGGFPLVYSRCGCVPVWASEIEEFPVAVTKIRFEEYEILCQNLINWKNT